MADQKVDIATYCRICLRNSPNCRPIYRTSEIDENTVVLDLIRKCTTLKLTMHENYPTGVCEKCFGQLRICHEFYVQCLLSEVILHQDTSFNTIENVVVKREILETNVKKEDCTDDYSIDNVSAELPVKSELNDIKADDDKQTNNAKTLTTCRPSNPKKKVLENPAERLKCPFCSCSSKNFCVLKIHMHRRHQQYPCPYCDATFPSRLEKIEHRKLQHPFSNVKKIPVEKVASRLLCSFCPSTSKNFRVLKIHMHKHHQTYLCPNCYAHFSSRAEVLEHRRLKHPFRKSEDDIDSVTNENVTHSTPTKKRPNQRRKFGSSGQILNLCILCSKQCASRTDLRAHVQAVHKGADSMVQCNKCSYKSPTYRMMYSHATNKHVRSDYLCMHCGKTLIGWSSWRQHIKRIHLKSYEHACADCDKRFLFPHELRSHVAAYHSIERNFNCNFCDKAFATNRQLKDHLRYHMFTGEYKCSVCSHEFKHKSSLQKHLKLHGEKKFHCEFCDMTFAVKKYLSTHLRRRHNDGESTVKSST